MVLFENLIREFEDNKVRFYLVDTNKERHSFRLISYFGILYQVLTKLNKSDTLLINSSGDYLYLLPPIFLINSLYNKKLFLRKFGGELNQTLKNRIKGPIIRYLFPKLDGLFLESKTLVKIFSEINKNVFWFPNVRQKPLFTVKPNVFSGKFVFINQLRSVKGVGILIEAFKELDKKYTIDFYGPLYDENLERQMENYSNIHYRGTLLPEKVQSLLSNYDVVILPTWYEGEG